MPEIFSKQIFLSIIIVSLILLFPIFSWAQETSNLIPASKWIDRDIYGKSRGYSRRGLAGRDRLQAAGIYGLRNFA
ncbi:MAG: hypothetical protein P8X90_33235 [Desulfobacterales bacterium]